MSLVAKDKLWVNIFITYQLTEFLTMTSQIGFYNYNLWSCFLPKEKTYGRVGRDPTSYLIYNIKINNRYLTIELIIKYW